MNYPVPRQYSELFTNDIFRIRQGPGTAYQFEGIVSFGRLAAYLMRDETMIMTGKYLLEVVGRYDGSYRYAPSKRWTFFPSVSAGWRLSEESFIKDNLPFITNLKIRGSFGQSGYDAGDPFQYVSAYNSASNGYVFDGTSQIMGMVAPGVVTDRLSWVTSSISNVGLDFDLWNGKLSGTIEWFKS